MKMQFDTVEVFIAVDMKTKTARPVFGATVNDAGQNWLKHMAASSKNTTIEQLTAYMHNYVRFMPCAELIGNQH